MKSIFTFFLILSVSASLYGQAAAKTKKVTNKDLKVLVKQMSGVFSNEKQAQSDTNFFHIRLVMKPIWKERKDGYWLYVEQAAAKKLNKPYRQRVYHVFIQDKYTLASEVYELHAPMRFAGEWEKPQALSSLHVDSLVSKDGCAVLLKKQSSTDFAGGTNGKACKSTLGGATYAVSSVTITAKGVFSLDQGFDSTDKQVWGSTFGAYQFIKQKALE